MSHLNAMKTKIRGTDKEEFIKAIMRHMHLRRQDIEVHDRAQRINGYHTEDNFVGHIIVRKGKTGIPCDIGWELKPDGFYEAHVDEYDYHGLGWANCTTRLDAAWSKRLQETHNMEVTKKGLMTRGIEFEESEKDGLPVLTFYMEPEQKSGLINL